MESVGPNPRLSRISTVWTEVFQAHAGPVDAALSAQRELLERYRGAIFRYLLAAVRDPDTADDLCQEFALRFLRGDFHRADPERGRFRDYLKTALIRLVTDHHRARQRRPQPMPAAAPEPAAPGADSDENTFVAGWRTELLDRTWKALAMARPAYHAALLGRIENPEASSSELAEQLSRHLGRALTADWVRKTLERAHKKYAELLVAEVAASLEDTTDLAVREELKALDLLKYCRSALATTG
jgi:RNA polymerase sigma-70 factor (ECF subfamily)